MPNFWTNLDKPFSVLAPMDDVTDNVFRQVVLSVGRPDVFFTEFSNVDGLVHGANGIPLRKLDYSPNQHPIVAQIWGSEPTNFEKAARMVAKLGFDGVDINMGCPIREVVRNGAGSGLIGKYEVSEKIIKAVKSGAGGLPVSVKTRLGNRENIAEDWVTFLLKQDLAALTVHARIAKQMSTGEANWDEIEKIVKIRDRVSPKTLIVGNGDVKSYAEILEKHNKYGVDGVMIGRGIFANPWVFDPTSKNHTKDEYIELLKKHIELFEKTWGETKNFAIIKKFFKMYLNNFHGASSLRMKLMETKNFEEVKEILSLK